MKTKCPHCQTKLKVQDGATGKKGNCPKCSQSFVITPLARDNTVEVCSLCSKEIGRLEKACVLSGKTICVECEKQVRGDSIPGIETDRPVRSNKKERMICPNCGQPFRADDSMPERDIRCPFCSSMINPSEDPEEDNLRANTISHTVRNWIMVCSIGLIICWFLPHMQTRETSSFGLETVRYMYGFQSKTGFTKSGIFLPGRLVPFFAVLAAIASISRVACLIVVVPSVAAILSIAHGLVPIILFSDSRAGGPAVGAYLSVVVGVVILAVILSFLRSLQTKD